MLDVSLNLMMSVSFSVSISMAVSVMAVVSSLAYLSGMLVWNFLAELFWNLLALFYRYFEWNLSGYWVADLSWFIMTSWGSCNDLGGWDTVSFWDWYTSWYLDGSWYLDWDISALTFGFNTAKWGNSNWGWSYSNWGWSNNWSNASTEKKLFSITGFGIRFSFWFSFWGTLGNNMSSSWYSESSWSWENSSWETELALSSQESSIEGWAGDSSNSWGSDSSYYSWDGRNLVANKLSVMFNSNKFGVLGYSGFLAYLMLDVLAFLLNNGINNGLYFSGASLFSMGGASWLSWYGLLGWYAYLFGYGGADIIYFGTVLGGWDQSTYWLGDGLAYAFVSGVIDGVALLYWFSYMSIRSGMSFSMITVSSLASPSITFVSKVTTISWFGVSLSVSVGISSGDSKQYTQCYENLHFDL